MPFSARDRVGERYIAAMSKGSRRRQPALLRGHVPLLLISLAVGCGGGPDVSGHEHDGGGQRVEPCGVTSTPCARREAVAARLTLPTAPTDLAVDLDGDGHPDNAYGAILRVLASQGFAPQAMQDAAVLSGQAIVLVNEDSIDPAFATDPGSAVGRILRGVPQGDPDYSGAGTFTLDTAAGAAVYQGPIVQDVFTSTTTDAPTTPLPLMPAQSGQALPLYAARLILTNASGGLVAGQINGAWKASDVQTTLLPSMAVALSQEIAADPTAQSSQNLKQIFDQGDGSGGSCMDADGSTSQPNDGVIGACELAGNSLVTSLFAPDVQLFDASGRYAPVPSGPNKNGLSVGVGLTLVTAQF